jgi:hypothetical protein
MDAHYIGTHIGLYNAVICRPYLPKSVASLKHVLIMWDLSLISRLFVCSVSRVVAVVQVKRQVWSICTQYWDFYEPSTQLQILNMCGFINRVLTATQTCWSWCNVVNWIELACAPIELTGLAALILNEFKPIYYFGETPIRIGNMTDMVLSNWLWVIGLCG